MRIAAATAAHRLVVFIPACSAEGSGALGFVQAGDNSAVNIDIVNTVIDMVNCLEMVAHTGRY
jgi:hypothetical protein